MIGRCFANPTQVIQVYSLPPKIEGAPPNIIDIWAHPKQRRDDLACRFFKFKYSEGRDKAKKICDNCQFYGEPVEDDIPDNLVTMPTGGQG